LGIQNFEIRNHPQKLKSKIHIDATNKIKELFKKYHSKNNSNKHNISIFIGSTGAIMEALEYGCSAIHIVEEPALQIYSHFLYPNIKTKTINENIYFYSLKDSKKIINFGKKNYTFKSYLK
jgi:16S rRNA G966 N2-methylase RsmD